MGKYLIQRWQACAQSARSWTDGNDPEPVLEALAMTLALEVAGDLHSVAPHERDGLRRKGQRALLQLAPRADGQARSDDDVEAQRTAAALARDGLRALRGGPLRPAPRTASAATAGPGRARPPFADTPSAADTDAGAPAQPSAESLESALLSIAPPSQIRRWLTGDMDGFEAGALAVVIRTSVTALREVRLLGRQLALGDDGWADAANAPGAGRAPTEQALTEQALTKQRWAAAGVERPADGLMLTSILDPASGRSVAHLEALDAEAVVFEAEGVRRLAVYAETDAPVRLVASALTLEAQMPGYWQGRIDGDIQKLETTLYVGDHARPWTLVLQKRVPTA